VDIIGVSAWAIVGPNLERARSGERISFDYQIPYGTSRPRWVHGNYIPDKDANGIVKGIVVHVIDIEDRKQAELEREKFVSLVNSSQEFIGLCDLNFKPFYINDAGMRLVGIDSSERAFQTPVQEFFFPEDQQFIIQEFFPRVLREKSCEVEIRFRHFKTGAAIWMIYNVFYIKNDNGEPVGLATVSRDITESKMAAAAIREIEQRERLSSEKYLHELEEYKIELEMQNAALQQVSFDLKISQEHFMQLYDFAPVGYLTLAVDGKITEANHTAAKLLGMERDKLINRRFAQFIDDDYKERWYAFYLQATQHNAKQAIELPMYGDNGVNFFAQLNSQFISSNGELPLLRLALVDITERKAAEAELRETETRLSLIVEEVQAGYWDWNLLTSTLYLSPEWKRQIGFEDAELSNHWLAWNNQVHPDDLDFVMAATDNYIAGYQSDFDLQFRLRHKDGSYRWIHTRAALLHDQHQNPIRMLGINLDISEFKKATELNRKRDQMEQSFRLYVAVQTATAIAHELNQPLNAISSYSDVALQLLQSGNQNPQRLSEVIEKCGQQAQRAGQVIRQLLTLLHKGETISEPIDMNSLVHDVLDYVKANIELGSFKIELDLAAEIPMVIANQMHIQKVLIGLLRNGLESMQESGTEAGTITITTSNCLMDPAMLQVTVRDSGKGVADNHALKTIFQPFYTTKTKGIGMGLAINRALIEVHGGKMWAEQNDGPGITINFTLPFEL
jgi:PAS domain S-box-containing protein